MISVITFYKDCTIKKEKNFILDDLTHGSTIEDYLATLSNQVINNFQYIKHNLSLTIRIDSSQVNLEMGKEAKNYDYVKIQNFDGETGEKAYYYFVINKTWKAKNTIEIELSMDTLNTFQFNNEYIINKKTLVKREHIDRFETIVVERRFAFSAHTGLNTHPLGTFNAEVAFCGGVESAEYEVLEQSTGVIHGGTFSTYDNQGRTGIRFRCIGDTSGIVGIQATIRLKALKRKIHKKSEEINAPVYKNPTILDANLIEKGGLSGDWSLYYKNSSNQADSPVDCYLVPSSPINASIQNSSLDVLPHLTSTNDYYIFCYDYNTPDVKLKVNGATYTCYHTYEGGLFSYHGVVCYAFMKDSNNKVHFYKFAGNTQIIVSGNWTEISDNVTSATFETNLTQIKCYVSSSLPDATTFFENEMWDSPYATTTLTIGAMTQVLVKGKMSIDRTLEENIKLINIPYMPTSYQTDSNGIIFDECWTYDNTTQFMKLTNFETRFENPITTNVDSFIKYQIQAYEFNMSDLSANQINRIFEDSKLYHSDYFRPKFVYDSFTKVIPLEKVSIDVSSPDFEFEFIMSRNITSKFLFKLSQITFDYANEDYPDVIAVARNNEEVLYSSQYLNYLRNGFNFDVKAKERSLQASGIGMGLSIAGLLASAAFSASPVGIAGMVGSGISLVSQLVSFAKTTAQNEENVERKLQEAQNNSVNILNADDFDLLYAYTENKAKVSVYKVSDEMNRVLDDLFYYCGYVINEQKIPNVKTRKNFNFLQASLEIEDAYNIPDIIVNDIKEKFDNGVVFMHENNGAYDFNQVYENIELSLLNN